MDYYILLDVGGTEIKAGIMDESGRSCLAAPIHRPAHSDADRETILRHLTALIHELAQRIPIGQRLSGIGLAFPGEFDYPAGICKIHGVKKYDALYGVNLRAALSDRLCQGTAALHFFPMPPILFENDVSMFALGEAEAGAARQKKRALCICIGTGFGSAFLINGELATQGQGIPLNGYLFPVKYGSSTFDDCFSVRGIRRVAEIYTGIQMDGLTLAQSAAAGDSRAVKAWESFGASLADALSPWLESFCPETLLLGGQISASAKYFISPLQKVCQGRSIQLVCRPQTSNSVFYGLWSVLQKKADIPL